MARRVFLGLLFAIGLLGGEAPGVRNFKQVGDHVYRGAQPTAEGFDSLAKLGVRTVVDLRGGRDHERSEQGMVEHAGMRYVHVPLSGYTAPSDQQTAKLLALLDDDAGWPVFVHCKRGADRTGTVIACYRIAHDHWANQKALEEAKVHGMSWTEIRMQWYILRFRPLAAR
jgi:tyrosine-protein phosphatase SIW14